MAYAAILLLEAAADWWVTLLKEHHGRHLDDFAEFCVLLEKRFGSSLGLIEQGPNCVIFGGAKANL